MARTRPGTGGGLSQITVIVDAGLQPESAIDSLGVEGLKRGMDIFGSIGIFGKAIGGFWIMCIAWILCAPLGQTQDEATPLVQRLDYLQGYVEGNQSGNTTNLLAFRYSSALISNGRWGENERKVNLLKVPNSSSIYDAAISGDEAILFGRGRRGGYLARCDTSVAITNLTWRIMTTESLGRHTFYTFYLDTENRVVGFANQQYKDPARIMFQEKSWSPLLSTRLLPTEAPASKQKGAGTLSAQRTRATAPPQPESGGTLFSFHDGERGIWACQGNKHRRTMGYALQTLTRFIDGTIEQVRLESNEIAIAILPISDTELFVSLDNGGGIFVDRNAGTRLHKKLPPELTALKQHKIISWVASKPGDDSSLWLLLNQGRNLDGPKLTSSTARACSLWRWDSKKKALTLIDESVLRNQSTAHVIPMHVLEDERLLIGGRGEGLYIRDGLEPEDRHYFDWRHGLEAWGVAFIWSSEDAVTVKSDRGEWYRIHLDALAQPPVIEQPETTQLFEVEQGGFTSPLGPLIVTTLDGKRAIGHYTNGHWRAFRDLPDWIHGSHIRTISEDSLGRIWLEGERCDPFAAILLPDAKAPRQSNSVMYYSDRETAVETEMGNAADLRFVWSSQENFIPKRFGDRIILRDSKGFKQFGDGEWTRISPPQYFMNAFRNSPQIARSTRSFPNDPFSVPYENDDGDIRIDVEGIPYAIDGTNMVVTAEISPNPDALTQEERNPSYGMNLKETGGYVWRWEGTQLVGRNGKMSKNIKFSASPFRSLYPSIQPGPQGSLHLSSLAGANSQRQFIASVQPDYEQFTCEIALIGTKNQLEIQLLSASIPTNQIVLQTRIVPELFETGKLRYDALMEGQYKVEILATHADKDMYCGRITRFITIEGDYHKQFPGWIEALGAEDYREREEAEQKIRAVGEAARYYVQQATYDENVERRARAFRILYSLDQNLRGQLVPRNQHIVNGLRIQF